MESFMAQVLKASVQILGLHPSPDFAPLRERNGTKSGGQERRIDPIRWVPA